MKERTLKGRPLRKAKLSCLFVQPRGGRVWGQKKKGIKVGKKKKTL